MSKPKSRDPVPRFLAVMRREHDADRAVFVAQAWRNRVALVGRLSDDRPWEVLDRFSGPTMHLLQHILQAVEFPDEPTVDLSAKVARGKYPGHGRLNEYAGSLRDGDDFTACRRIVLTPRYRTTGAPQAPATTTTGGTR